MPQRRNVILHITVTAGAGVDGVTLFRAGGSNDAAFIMMPKRGQNLFLLIAAARTGAHLFSVQCAGGIFKCDPIAVCVPQWRGIIAGIAVAAGAGVKCIAPLCAGWFHNGCGIVMRMLQRGNGFVFGCATARAGVEFQAGRRLGWRGDNASSVPTVPQRIDIVIPMGFMAAGAGISGISLRGTGRGGNCGGVGMAERRNYLAGLCDFPARGAYVIAGVAVFGAGCVTDVLQRGGGVGTGGDNSQIAASISDILVKRPGACALAVGFRTGFKQKIGVA